MPEITMNGSTVKVAPDESVLDVARRQGVFIPTLCHHAGLGLYGACRLCLVEVKSGFRPGLTSSCSLPALNGLVVDTDTPMVREGRRLVAELLLARAPNAPEIRSLASSLGVTGTDLPTKDETCILCGRCVRACRALGLEAVSFAFRGAKREVMSPFDRTSETCIACQACITVCPTGAVTSKVTPDAVEMVEWHTRQELHRCPSCGKRFVTPRMQTRLHQMTPDDQHARTSLCPSCRRRDTAGDQTSTALFKEIR
ncbi:MAG: (2Fe-2S)-binding protein [Deltaproteobacteria bacterium]|nr:(2Fe-2S)-binding protein [Deltaproteobacteria bacterium]